MFGGIGNTWWRAALETLFHWGYWAVLVAVLLGGIYYFSRRRRNRGGGIR